MIGQPLDAIWAYVLASGRSIYDPWWRKAPLPTPFYAGYVLERLAR